MTVAFSPEEALARLDELVAELREAVVLDAGGRILAGREALARPARALLASVGDAAGPAGIDAIDVSLDEATVVAVRSARYAIAAVADRGVLPALLVWDVRHVLAELEREAA
jgi:hypothetical protein